MVNPRRNDWFTPASNETLRKHARSRGVDWAYLIENVDPEFGRLISFYRTAMTREQVMERIEELAVQQCVALMEFGVALNQLAQRYPPDVYRAAVLKTIPNGSESEEIEKEKRDA